MKEVIHYIKVSVSSSVLKNKKSTYFLLPVTLGIWGFIGYKVYQYMNADDEEIALTENVVPINVEKLAPDTFAIFNNYRDPFLGNDGKEMEGIKKVNSGNSYSGNSNAIKNPKRNTTVVPTNTVNANAGWPKISYNGMMLNESKKQAIGFVSVDGVSHRVKVGDKIGDLKIIDFNQNEVNIQRGKEKKTFGK